MRANGVFSNPVTSMLSNASYVSSPSLTTIATIVESMTGHSSSSTDVLQSTSESSLLEITTTGESPRTLDHHRELSVAYTAAEAAVSLLAIFGNALVAYVFCTTRSLRRYRNYYIFALAIADFLVGLLGIPFAVLASIGLPRNLYGCLFTVSILMVLCTISILCLVAVSIDRYWATTNPFAYYRHMTTSTAVGIILSCWIVGAVIGFLPLFGWYNLEGWYRQPSEYCYFTDVMDYNYLVFLYFATIVFPAILMGCFYGYIYHVVLIKIRQKGNLAPQIRRPSEQSRTGSLNSDNRGASQIQRIIVSEKRREAKAAHKLGIIVLFFMICWMPLYTINCVQAFCRDCKVPLPLLNFTIILSHANSSLNPLLYAYHLKEFRVAMKNALLMMFEKLLCGLMGGRLYKDGGALSRSQTLPSIGHAATIAGSTRKISIKFRRSPRPEQSRSVQISPKKGLVLSTLDNLHQNTITDKSLTSLSAASDTSNYILQEITQRIPTSASDMNPNRLRILDSPSSPSDSVGDVRYDFKHGIEIHVVNIDTENEIRKNGKQSNWQQDELPEATDVIEEAEMETNELDSSRGSNQMTTPL